MNGRKEENLLGDSAARARKGGQMEGGGVTGMGMRETGEEVGVRRELA